jgi:hypothetical protein
MVFIVKLNDFGVEVTNYSLGNSLDVKKFNANTEYPELTSTK